MSKEQVEHSAATHCYPLHGFVVMLEKGCWLADTDGDPGRTLQKKNAQLFSERADAVRALHFARGYRRFLNAEIIEVLTHNDCNNRCCGEKTMSDPETQDRNSGSLLGYPLFALR